jgi:hypothetical protein
MDILFENTCEVASMNGYMEKLLELAKITSNAPKCPPELRCIEFLGVTNRAFAALHGINHTIISQERSGDRKILLYKRLVYAWEGRTLIKARKSVSMRGFSESEKLHAKNMLHDAHNAFFDAWIEFMACPEDELYTAVDKANNEILERLEEGPVSKFLKNGGTLPIRILPDGTLVFSGDTAEYLKIIPPASESWPRMCADDREISSEKIMDNFRKQTHKHRPPKLKEFISEIDKEEE